jgi:hypothetical protein
MNIPKHVIDQKNMKWTFKGKSLQQSHHLNLFKFKKNK